MSNIKNMPTKISTLQSADNSNACLLFLKNRGGRAKLSELTFSRDVIQSLITKDIAKVKNTGTGFYLELEKQS
ncbi:hypothetical protein A6770_38415 [Nostoc minutum NIES-26]|uniref:Uncharacterized protein n=1 Tax=Nostoc minutum NIES-26 TaxID=1844469 RepID=A0A367RWI0_9NOSO|nr:hypothetical protein A6770_38415 [Nostoc minutum NIES-26]